MSGSRLFSLFGQWVPAGLFPVGLCLVAMVSTGCTNHEHTGTRATKGMSAVANNTTSSAVSFFTAQRPMTWTLTLAVDALVEQGQSQRVPGSNGEVQPKPAVPGNLLVRYTDATGGEESYEVLVEARGNTSLDSCLFPKYNLLFKEKATQGAFAGLKKIRVGSHCPMKEGKDEYGRIGGDAAVWREHLAYTLYRAFEPENALRTRVVEVDYADTSTNTSSRHPALVIETDSQLLNRTEQSEDVFEWSGEPLSQEYYRAREEWKYGISKRTRANTALVTELFETLIGNRDYGWHGNANGAMARRYSFEYWNVLPAVGSDGLVHIIPKDFDIAGLVAGHETNLNYLAQGAPLPGKTELGTLLVRHLLRLRQVYTQADVTAASDLFRTKRAELEALVDQTLPASDKEGVLLAKQTMQEFFAALDSPLTAAAYLSFSDFLWEAPLLKGADAGSGVLDACPALANLFPVQVLEYQGDFVRISVDKAACSTPAKAGAGATQEGWVSSRFVNASDKPPTP